MHKISFSNDLNFSLKVRLDIMKENQFELIRQDPGKRIYIEED
jgi:hypothetical protein